MRLDLIDTSQTVVSKLQRLEESVIERSCKEGADFHIWRTVCSLLLLFYENTDELESIEMQSKENTRENPF